MVKKKVDRECKGGAREKITNVLELAHASYRVADAPCLEIGDRQRHEMTKQSRAELDVDAVRGMREQVGAQDSESGLKDCDGRKADDEDVQRAHAAMHEHFVNHDLKKQRRDQGE
jgi:hypothetical protein